MSVEAVLQDRSGGKCELCGGEGPLSALAVEPGSEGTPDRSAFICEGCRSQIAGEVPVDPDYWRCLNASMWTAVPAIQVVAWRMLKRLEAEEWAAELREMLELLCLDEPTRSWAEAGAE